MPDPNVSFGGSSTEKDAEILRQKLRAARLGVQEFLGVPPTSVIGDDARRQKLEHSAENVAKTTAILAAAVRLIPGPVGRFVGPVLAGVEKTAEGQIRVGPGVGTNFAPSPFGFLDPTAVGLQRNFYLPGGSTRFIPRRLDQFGLGLPEQRQADAEAEARAELSRRATAAAAVAGLSDEDLLVIIERRTSLGPGGRVRATSGVSADDLIAAALAEQQLRAVGQGGEQSITDFVLGQLRAARRAGTVSTAAGGPADENPLLAALLELERLHAANPPDP